MAIQNYANPERLLSNYDLPPLAEFLRLKRERREPTAEDRFKWTLNGFVMEIVLMYGPVTTEFVVSSVRANLRVLRRIDGTPYTEDVDRMVSGCLSITDLFLRSHSGWTVDPAGARRYREKAMKSIQRVTVAAPIPQKKPKNLPCRKPQRLLAMFQSFSHKVNNDPETAVYIQNPFSGVSGNEDVVEIVKTLGEDKAVGMVLAYELMKENYRQISDEGTSSEAAAELGTLLRDTLQKLLHTEELSHAKKRPN